MQRQCSQCGGSGEFPIIGSQCTGCFGFGFIEIEKSIEEKIEQLISSIEEHEGRLITTAQRIRAYSYIEDVAWGRIIDSLETLRDKWLPKTISEAKELEKIAEENYKKETEE